jgi:hypothetical protein
MSIIRTVAAGAAVLLAKGAWADLRTYEVDVQYQQEVYGALQQTLIANPIDALPGTAYGRVERLPNGQILVDAKPETHEQIERLIAAINERQVGRAPRATLRYWVLLGSHDGTSDAASPAILAEVLDELERVHGDLNFEVLGTASLVTESGQSGKASGEPLAVEQRVYVDGNTASAELKLRFVQSGPRLTTTQPGPGPTTPFLTVVKPYEGGLELNVTLNGGEFLVLGENTVRTTGLEGTLFYIVQWADYE